MQNMKLMPLSLVRLSIALACMASVRAAEEPADEAWRADRPLSAEQLQAIAKLSDTLITKSVDADANARQRWEEQRDTAALDLGDLHHRACLPALLAVVRDSSASPRLRQRCVAALGSVRDKRVIDVLFEQMLDENPSVSGESFVQLHHAMPGDKYYFQKDWKKPQMQQEVEKWRAQWRQNYDRAAVVSNQEAGWIKLP